jgi:hypothetical protein
LKNDGVRQWGWDDIPYMMENKKWLKPPISIGWLWLVNFYEKSHESYSATP